MKVLYSAVGDSIGRLRALDGDVESGENFMLNMVCGADFSALNWE